LFWSHHFQIIEAALVLNPIFMQQRSQRNMFFLPEFQSQRLVFQCPLLLSHFFGASVPRAVS
jgi:hypothetical protein